MARILIDGRFIGVGESVSRYTLEMLKGILNLDRENDYTLLVRPHGKKDVQTYFGEKKGKDWPGNLKLHVFDVPHYSFSEQTKLLQYLNKEKFDLVHFTQFNHPVLYKGKFVITIHDLTMFGHLHNQGAIKRIAFGGVMRSAIRNSVKILTVSETSKKELMDSYRLAPDKIEVTYNGVDPKFNIKVKSQESGVKSFREKYGICGDYLLYTGMWKKHKNILRMLSAFERYAAEQKIENLSLQLVLVGKKDPREPEVMTEINRINDSYKYKEACKQLFVTTGFIDEAELPIAYAGARAYIIPSLSEGFGMPPLEAMACGTPVISSNESCMPEVLGDAAYYFNPYEINDIKGAIEKIITDEKLRSDLIPKGIAQAAKYSWHKTAEGTLRIYREVLASV